MSLRFTAVAMLATALLLIQFPVSGEPRRPVIMKAVGLGVDLRQPNLVGITRSVLHNMGGVVSLADQLRDRAGNPLPVSLAIEPQGGVYPGYITVRRLNVPVLGQYVIDYADLVPMALFVDGGTTSLYTYWEEDYLPPNFQRDAGFVRHPQKGFVALEFRDTVFSEALYYIDICTLCLRNDDDSLLVDLQLDRRQSFGGSAPLEFINADRELGKRPYRVRMERGKRIGIDGDIVRFWLRGSRSEGIVNHRAALLADPDQVRKRYYTNGLHEEYAQYANAFFLFETLTLLRAAKASDPVEWSEFVQALSSETLANAEIEVWERYTRSVCSVYANKFDECAMW